MCTRQKGWGGDFLTYKLSIIDFILVERDV